MAKDDRARFGFRANGFDDFSVAGLRPVARIDATEHTAEAVASRSLVLAKSTVGRAKPRGAMMQRFVDDFLRPFDFVGNVLVRKRRQFRVREGVVADLVTLGENAAGQIGRGGNLLANHEKGRGYLTPLEFVENHLRHTRRRTVVERTRPAVAVARTAIMERDLRRGGNRGRGGFARSWGDLVQQRLRCRGDSGTYRHSGEGPSERLQKFPPRHGHDPKTSSEGRARPSIIDNAQ